MDRMITTIKRQRNKNRVNIYLDGEFAFGLSRVIASRLQVGQKLSEAQILELQDEDASEIAYQKALNFLSYRIRSEAEIEQHLRKHVIPDDITNAVLKRLRRAGLVDDREFAWTWLENRNQLRPRGRRALLVELRQKRIPDEIIDEVLSTVDEEELAYRAALRRATRLQGLEDVSFRKKLSDHLARRGFPYDIIRSVVQRVQEEQTS